MSDEPRRRVASAAKALLDGELGVIEAARLIVAWQKKGKLRDEEGLVFAGIAEETDHLPDGMDGERLLYEERHLNAAKAAAKKLVARYEPRSADNH